jgi:hypothetical protein
VFSSSQLSEIFAKNQSLFQRYIEDINQVSADIRLLESKLKDFGISFPFFLLCRHYTEVDPESVNLELGVFGIEYHYYEYLAWKSNEKEKNPSFRIFYQIFKQSGYIQSDGPILLGKEKQSDTKVLERRPLIETPVHVRIKMYPFLSAFLEKLAVEISKFQGDLNFDHFKTNLNSLDKELQ